MKGIAEIVVAAAGRDDTRLVCTDSG